MSVTRNGVKHSEEHAMVLIKLYCPDWNSADKSLSEFQFKNSYHADKVRHIRAGRLFLCFHNILKTFFLKVFVSESLAKFPVVEIYRVLAKTTNSGLAVFTQRAITPRIWSFYQKCLQKKWAYLRLYTTHAFDFWYSNRWSASFIIPKVRWVGCV